jgi:hypothetical protein
MKSVKSVILYLHYSLSFSNPRHKSRRPSARAPKGVYLIEMENHGHHGFHGREPVCYALALFA